MTRKRTSAKTCLRGRMSAPPARMRRAVLKLLALCSMLALLVAFVLPALRPARVAAQNSGGGAPLELIPAGSLVIPMDNTLQAIGTPFNLKAYGAVERLLWAGIPVKWAIQPGKAKDGVDFTATAQRLYPSAVAASSLNFSGGPFIVHRDLAVAAKAAISAYATSNNVAVYETTADVTVSVRHTLTHKPKVAVFDDGASATIHTDYLLAAGFVSGTHYDIIPAATLITINASACFTIGTEPHFGATGTAADPQANAVRQFVQSGGNFLAECEGIATYENNAAYGHYQTTGGVLTGNARTGIQYPNPDLPYSQFIGAMADVGGSVRDFQPADTSAYRATVEMHAQSPTGTLGGAAGVLPAKGTVARLAGPAVGGFVFYLGGHQYTTGDLGNINGIRMYLNAVLTPSARPSTCGLTLTPRTIAGTIYEDVNGDSSLADGVVRPGVSVRLYQDANNNGVVDTGDTYLVATTTDAAGRYSFTVAPQSSTGANYLVAVDSKGVQPTAGLIAGRGNAWAEQTYGDDPTTAALDLGARFGGRQSAVSDNFNAASTTPANNTYEHLARVDVSAADVPNANFGFSFNVVTTMRGGDAADDDTGDAARTVQGSLRQFIQNANAISGANAMRFVPAVALNAGTYWQLAVTSALPAIIDASTTIDGTAYSNTNGTTVRDTNAGLLGAGGTVGVDALALAQVARPELEVVDGSTIAIGLDVAAANTVIRRIAIYGFGTTANNDAQGNIRLTSAATAALVEQNFLGSTATSFTDPGATRSGGDNLRVVSAIGGIVRNNLIGYSAGKGVQLGAGATGWLVEANEVRGNGINNSNLGGIEVENGSGNDTIRGNLCAGNEAPGIDTNQSSGGNLVQNNTVTGNGIGANANVETPGVRIYGTNNTVQRNIINANYGAGVMVTSSANANRITQNSIYTNGTIVNKVGAARSNQIGIDLLSAANSQTTGTSPFVTVNDAGDADAGGNGLLNFPVLVGAQILNGNLVLTGYVAPGADIEFFIAESPADPSGFGEGRTYLLTLTEGTAADTDATNGTYTSPVNGLNVGTDTTNKFKFTIPMPAGVSTGTLLTATATVGGSTSEFSGNVTVAASPPDIQLGKTIAPAAGPYTPGMELTYTVTFTNNGGADATSFIIYDMIPASTTFKVGSVTYDAGTSGIPAPTVDYSQQARSTASPPVPPSPWTNYTPTGTFDANVTWIRWTFAPIPPGKSATVTFTVRIQ